jgi:hypothetical protein
VCYLVFGVSARVTVTVGWSDCDSLYLVLGNSGFLPAIVLYSEYVFSNMSVTSSRHHYRLPIARLRRVTVWSSLLLCLRSTPTSSRPSHSYTYFLFPRLICTGSRPDARRQPHSIPVKNSIPVASRIARAPDRAQARKRSARTQSINFIEASRY